MNTEKHIQYGAKLIATIGEMINNEDHEQHISKEELLDENNLTEFIHALANILPNMIYNSLTGDEKNNLEFNHLANQLVFQYSKSVKED